MTVSTIQRGDPLTMVHCGHPVDNTTAVLLDRCGNLSPLGAWGELAVGGKCLAQGYLNRSDLTKKAFILNPFGPGRLYRTGDYFRWTNDGCLKFKGRIDDQIKIQAITVEIGEIENLILRTEKVENCCVKIRPDQFGGKQLVAYVKALDLSETEVRHHCEANLPIYMVPQRVVFVDDLKLTSSGKIDGSALPEISKQTEKNVPEQPDSLELQVIKLFEEVLRTDNVLPTSDFFILGGHSMLSIMVMERINELFGVHISIHQFNGRSSPRKLANFISKTAKHLPKAFCDNHHQCQPVVPRQACRTIEKGPAIHHSPVSYDHIPEGGRNVLIIGAGIAGIMAAITLKQRGIHFKVVEQWSDIGGIWFNGCNQKSRLQTPSEFYSADHSVKHKYLHPNRQQMLEYLNQIVDFHDLRKKISFNTQVVNVTDSGRGFQIQVRSGSSEKVLYHDGILVCTGKHQVPFIPDWPVTSEAPPPIIHASSLDGVDLRGKRVTVVGAGSYAIEAVQIASVEGAEHIDVVARAFHWILPTFAYTMMNSSIDFQSMTLRPDYERMSKALIAHLKKYYIQSHLEHIIPRPEKQPFDANLSISDEFFLLCQKASVEFFESQISEILSDSVMLENGMNLPTDIIIAETGYRDPEFPFLHGICQNPVVYKGFMLAQDPRIGFAGMLDMVGSSTGVLAVNFNAALAVMRDRRSRPTEAEVEEWLSIMPEDLIKNVKSHVSWIVDMQIAEPIISCKDLPLTR